MINKLIIVFFLVFAVSFSAFAANNTADIKYNEWSDVVGYLQSKGIVTDKIDWSGIDAVCMFIKNTKGDVAFNKCRADNALLQNQYLSDSSYCDARSQEKYFEYIKPTITTTVALNIKGERVVSQESRVVLTATQISDYKNGVFITCMHDVGWNNSSSWVAGKR